jgi:hypothetical protein
MGQVNATGIKGFDCTQAVGQNLRVKLDGTYGLELAGATDREIGVVGQAHLVTGLGSGQQAQVILPNAPGTLIMVAAGDFAAGDTVFGAADGKIDKDSNSNPIGIALEASAAAGDEVEVLRMPSMYTPHTHA